MFVELGDMPEKRRHGGKRSEIGRGTRFPKKIAPVDSGSTG